MSSARGLSSCRRSLRDKRKRPRMGKFFGTERTRFLRSYLARNSWKEDRRGGLAQVQIERNGAYCDPGGAPSSSICRIWWPGWPEAGARWEPKGKLVAAWVNYRATAPLLLLLTFWIETFSARDVPYARFCHVAGINVRGGRWLICNDRIMLCGDCAALVGRFCGSGPVRYSLAVSPIFCTTGWEKLLERCGILGDFIVGGECKIGGVGTEVCCRIWSVFGLILGVEWSS